MKYNTLSSVLPIPEWGKTKELQGNGKKVRKAIGDLGSDGSFRNCRDGWSKELSLFAFHSAPCLITSFSKFTRENSPSI
jgi:hypothetical protein